MKINLNKMANRINKRIYCLLLTLLISLPVFSQGNIGINATGLPPNASAGLDVDFLDKGLLIPRVALTNTSSFTPLSAHVAGMIVYNTATTGDVVPGFYYNNGTNWIPGFLTGTAVGDMLYWNGGHWVMIPIGLPGQFLQVTGSNIPAWGGTTFSTIITTPASSITGISAISGGNITSDGGSAVIMRGVCWGITSGPTIANSKTVDGSGIGIFTSSLTGLLPATTYYVRAYSINSNVVSYGNEISFITLANLPTLAATFAASAITGTTAHSGGNVTSDGGSAIIERGICYATTSNPTTANLKVIDPAPGVGSFGSNLSGLTAGTTYYVRAYAINSVGTAYGSQISFTTLQIPPTIITTAAINILSFSATSGGTYTLNGLGGNLWNYGVAYSTVPNSPTPTYVQTGTTPVPTPFTTNLTGLLGNTTYYIRAYIQGYWNGASAYDFGNELSFTTPAPVLPTVTTTAVTNITTNSGLSGGNVTNNGGAIVTTRGVCWSTSPNPDTTNSKIASGSGNGIYSTTITPLLPGTMYHVRAYAVNSVGVAYGSDQVFTTCSTPIYNIGDYVGGGVVFYVDCSGQNGLIAATVDQGTIVQYGCQGTVTGATGTAIFSGAANTDAILAACATPGIAASLCRNYNGGGYSDWYLPSSGELQQMYNQRGVIPNLTYGLFTYWSSTEGSATVASGFFFYGGYAQAAMKGYGTQMVARAIRAFHGPQIPVVTTDITTNITTNSATSGGNVSSDGGAAVTERGVCWSTTTGPTITDPRTSDGTGTGAFVSNITGLTTGLTYYVRAYATNSVGTSYGNEETFVPAAPGLPTVTTDPMLNLIGAMAEGGGTVVSDGGDPVTAFGVCWSTTPNPTIITNLGMTTDGSGIGTYYSILTGLSIGTTYYLCAYATNGSGTAYGSDVSFTATAATIGQFVSGGSIWGNVFYIDGTGLHGLIADPWGFGTSDWGCNGTFAGASGTAVGTGQANTTSIIADITANSCTSAAPAGAFAAQISQWLGPDWYLPSKDEFDLLWTNRVAAGLDAALSPSFPFWSSSEVNTNTNTPVWFFDGTIWDNTGVKSDLYTVWPIRSF
jgi:hypothetical protein